MARFIKKHESLEPRSGYGLVLACPDCGGRLDLTYLRDGDQAYWCHTCERGWRAGNLPDNARQSKDAARERTNAAEASATPQVSIKQATREPETPAAANSKPRIPLGKTAVTGDQKLMVVRPPRESRAVTKRDTLTGGSLTLPVPSIQKPSVKPLIVLPKPRATKPIPEPLSGAKISIAKPGVAKDSVAKPRAKSFQDELFALPELRTKKKRAVSPSPQGTRSLEQAEIAKPRGKTASRPPISAAPVPAPTQPSRSALGSKVAAETRPTKLNRRAAPVTLEAQPSRTKQKSVKLEAAAKPLSRKPQVAVQPPRKASRQAVPEKASAGKAVPGKSLSQRRPGKSEAPKTAARDSKATKPSLAPPGKTRTAKTKPEQQTPQARGQKTKSQASKSPKLLAPQRKPGARQADKPSKKLEAAKTVSTPTQRKAKFAAPAAKLAPSKAKKLSAVTPPVKAPAKKQFTEKRPIKKPAAKLEPKLQKLAIETSRPSRGSSKAASPQPKPSARGKMPSATKIAPPRTAARVAPKAPAKTPVKPRAKAVVAAATKPRAGRDSSKLSRKSAAPVTARKPKLETKRAAKSKAEVRASSGSGARQPKAAPVNLKPQRARK